MSAQRRVTILLTDSEYAKIKVRAGMAPVGTYIRSLLFPECWCRQTPCYCQKTVLEHAQECDSEGKAELGISDAVQPAPRKSKAKETKAAGTCPHGVSKGWRCTLCGGIVK